MPDTIKKTLAVAAVVCLFCSVFVSLSAVFLKPRQEKNKRLERQQNILLAAGLLSGQDMSPAAIEQAMKRVKTRVLDLKDGWYTEKRPGTGTEKEHINLSPETDYAGLFKIDRYQEVYEILGDSGLNGVVLPITGMGLWGRMYGYLALAADLSTVMGLTYYEHKETPGLGGEVDNPLWKNKWNGKKIRSRGGNFIFQVVKGTLPPGQASPHKVDGLSGASITTRSVQNTMRFWFSETGYLPYLNRLIKNISERSR